MSEGPSPAVLDPAGAAAPRTRPRDPYWDNVRLVAIACVVCGHAIEPLSKSDAMYSLYLLIYAFHMPLLAISSGAFARAEPITTAEGGKIIKQLVVPYLLFSVLWALLRWAYGGEPLDLDLTSPYWHLWFLTALAAWRLTLPLIAALKYPLAWAVVVAVASGYMSTVGWRFDASRTLGFLPFFVLGWWLRQRGVFERLAAFRARARVQAVAIGLAGLALAAVASVVGVDAARAHNLRGWVQLERNYADLGATTWAAGGERLLVMAASVVLSLCVLLVVPRIGGRISHWGQVTMYVYLLHMFPLYLLRESGAYASAADSGTLQLVLVASALVLTAVLCLKPVVVATRWLVEPQWASRLLRAPQARR